MADRTKKWKKRKITRLVPREALFVSLVGSPSAKASRHVVIRRKGEPDPDGADSLLLYRSQRTADVQLADDEVELRLHAKITRVDKTRRVVYAQVYNQPWDPDPNAKVTRADIDRHVDTYDTFMTQGDIEFLAHRFLEVSRAVDVEHDEIAGAGTPVESFIVRSDDGKGWGYPGGRWEERAWVMGTRVDEDEQWKKVERGIDEPEATTDVIRGYSISAIVKKEERYVLVEDDGQKVERDDTPAPADPADDKPEAGVVAKVLRSVGLGFLLKDETEEKVERDEKVVTDFATAWKAQIDEQRLNTARWTLYRVMTNILEDEDTDDKAAAIGKAIDQYKAVVISMLAKSDSTVERSAKTDPLGLLDALYVEERVGKKMSASRRKKLEAAIAELSAILAEVAEDSDNARETRSEETDDVDPKELEKIVRGAVEAATKPLNERLERIERAQQLADGETEETLAIREKLAGMPEEVIERAVAAVKGKQPEAEAKTGDKGSKETRSEAKPEAKPDEGEGVEDRIKRAVDEALGPYAEHIEGLQVTLKAERAEKKALKDTQPAAGAKVTRADRDGGDRGEFDAVIDDPMLDHEERRKALEVVNGEGGSKKVQRSSGRPWWTGRFGGNRAANG